MEILNIQDVQNAQDLFAPLYQNNETVSVKTPYGGYVIMAEQDYLDYLGWKATIEIEANPGLNQHLLNSKDTPTSEGIPWTEVDWDHV